MSNIITRAPKVALFGVRAILLPHPTDQELEECIVDLWSPIICVQTVWGVLEGFMVG